MSWLTGGSPARRGQAFVTGVALVLSIAVVRVGLDDAAERSTPGDVALTLTIGWSFVASGLVAWRLRPENRIGLVMVLTGLFRLVANLDAAEDAVLFSIARAVQPWSYVGIAYILLVFPSGHVRRTSERVLVAVILVVGVLLTTVYPALGGVHGPCAGCPENVFEVAHVPAVAAPLHDVTLLVGAVAAVVALGVLVQRWRRASPRLRFEIAPVLWAGAAAFLALGVLLVVMAIPDAPAAAPELVMGILLALVPVAFLVGVGRTRLARSRVADLVQELSGTPPPGAPCSSAGACAQLRDALANVLHDPSLEVAYWLPDRARYVDDLGQTMTLPVDSETRAVTMVEHGGRPIAALIHDPAVRDDRHLVASVSAAAGLVLENAQLQADLQARLVDLAASRTRIVEAEEAERRRIERDLHDGTQQRLVSLAMTLGLAEARAANDPGGTRTLLREARIGLADALQELRELSQGIHPSILTERGLPGAVDELAGRARLPVQVDVQLARRLPEHVEAAAYFVIAEAVTNIAKHADATSARIAVAERAGALRVEVSDDGRGGAEEGLGTGLKGLRDRVEAIGGRLLLRSVAGVGTTIEVVIPCGS